MDRTLTVTTGPSITREPPVFPGGGGSPQNIASSVLSRPRRSFDHLHADRDEHRFSNEGDDEGSAAVPSHGQPHRQSPPIGKRIFLAESPFTDVSVDEA